MEKKLQAEIEETKDRLKLYQQTKKVREREQQIKNAAARTKKCIEKGAVAELLGLLDVRNAVILGCLLEAKDDILGASEKAKAWERMGQKIYDERAAKREAERQARRDAKNREAGECNQ